MKQKSIHSSRNLPLIRVSRVIRGSSLFLAYRWLPEDSVMLLPDELDLNPSKTHDLISITFENAICLGATGKHRGRTYRWDDEKSRLPMSGMERSRRPIASR